MTRTARTRTASLLIGAVVGALALTGCGAGADAQTAGQVASAGGANAGSGTILVRDAQIVFGEQVEGGVVHASGTDAPLVMTIVNEGAADDRIVAAESPWADSVTVSGDPTVPAGDALVIAGRSGEAPSTGGSADAGTQLVLTGLLDDLRAGPTYEVVLTFEQAGEIALQVPVGDTDEPREDEPAE